jgi:alpha-glucosidase (family GH31 glycosyl hydrolase)
MKPNLFLFIAVSAVAVLAHAQEAPLNWQPVAPGVWSARIGKPEAVDLLKTAGIQPKVDALNKLGKLAFPTSMKASVARLANGQTHLRLPLREGEQLFGLGLNFKNVLQRKRVFNLHADHYGGRDSGRTHAPVPFYVSSEGYGVLINSARYVTVYAGTGVRKDSAHPPKIKDRNTDRTWEAQPYSDAVEVLIPAAGVEVFLFAGRSAMEAVQRYNLYNGGGALPPKWGLGFTQRVPTKFTADEVRQEADAFEQHGFPLDFIGLEPGWQSRSYPGTFAWDKGRFPDPAGFVKEMLQRGIRLNLWLNPYVSPESPIYDAVKPYTGTHTVWNGLAPDFTLPQVQRAFKTFFAKEHLDLGISGYKIDEIDGYDQWLWPDVASFPSGLSGEQMRQIYGLLVQRQTADWFRARNQRTWGLVRGSNAGASALPYVIYNDYYDHRDFITALCNSSFLGVLWTPEVRASKTAEEWLRRMQSVCFSPLAMLNAWADGTKPWTFPEVEAQVKEVALLRMRLLPYIYTAFAQYHFEGKPPVRAMYLTEGFTASSQQQAGKLDSTANPYATALRQEVKDQFMLGDNLLVAPMFAGDKSRKVILPAGKWYDFYTGKLAGAGEIITVTPGLDQIPLFVRDGGIIPLIPAATRAPKHDDILPVEVRHYGESASRFALYDDDGETFDYERGAFTWTDLMASRDVNGSLQGKVELPQNARAVRYHDFKWVFMTKP